MRMSLAVKSASVAALGIAFVGPQARVNAVNCDEFWSESSYCNDFDIEGVCVGGATCSEQGEQADCMEYLDDEFGTEAWSCCFVRDNAICDDEPCGPSGKQLTCDFYPDELH